MSAHGRRGGPPDAQTAKRFFYQTGSPVGVLGIASDGTCITGVTFERGLGDNPPPFTVVSENNRSYCAENAALNRASTGRTSPRRFQLDSRIVFNRNDHTGGPDEVIRLCVKDLDAYFAGKLTAFTVPLAPAGTAFQTRVWEELRRIPYGQTVSYKELALRAGNARAVRAVGGANHRNPIVILIPCHRVIGADGGLTGFGGGLPAKEFLLALEGARPR